MALGNEYCTHMCICIFVCDCLCMHILTQRLNEYMYTCMCICVYVHRHFGSADCSDLRKSIHACIHKYIEHLNVIHNSHISAHICMLRNACTMHATRCMNHACYAMHEPCMLRDAWTMHATRCMNHACYAMHEPATRCHRVSWRSQGDSLRPYTYTYLGNL